MNSIKQLIVVGLLFGIQTSTFSQYWAGFETGRFSGISSATMRPGGMSPMPFKVDVNLFGMHVNTQPDNLFSSNFAKVMMTGGFYQFAGFSQLTANRTDVITNMQGPSFMVQATPKLAIAFAWNTRQMWLSDFTAPEVSNLFDDETTPLSLNVSNESANILYAGWNEFGIGVGGMVYEEGFHSFSIGAFAKLIYGTGQMSTNITDLSVRATGTTVNQMSFNVDGIITDNLYGVVDDGTLNFADKAGYGFDIGAEYKFINPRTCPGGSNYRLKVGFALNDIGRVSYNGVSSYTKTSATEEDIPLSTFRQSTFLETTNTLSQIFNINNTLGSTYSVALPMGLRLYTEVNIKRRAIIYGELQFVFAQMMNPEIPMYVRFNITPRFEDDRFGIYVPITVTNYTPINAGLAIRMKPLIIGSGNLMTFFAYDDRGTALDFYVMLKIPILNDNERVDWKAVMKRR